MLLKNLIKTSSSRSKCCSLFLSFWTWLPLWVRLITISTNTEFFANFKTRAKRPICLNVVLAYAIYNPPTKSKILNISAGISKSPVHLTPWWTSVTGQSDHSRARTSSLSVKPSIRSEAGVKDLSNLLRTLWEMDGVSRLVWQPGQREGPPRRKT